MASAEASQSIRRVVVYGASNVTLGLPTVVELIRSGFDGPLRIEIADGHGRSYGKWTSVLFRSVPGHAICSVPVDLNVNQLTNAVLADIGNDLVYGVSIEQTTEWVRQVAERLAGSGTEIVMTGLPLESVRNLSRVRFNFFRKVFFPGSPLGVDGLIDKVESLNEAIHELAKSVNARVLELDAEWYGVDPIHIRRNCRRVAWSRVFSEWSEWEAGKSDSASFSLLRKLQLWRNNPQEYKVLGKPKSHSRTMVLDSETELRFF